MSQLYNALQCISGSQAQGSMYDSRSFYFSGQSLKNVTIGNFSIFLLIEYEDIRYETPGVYTGQ